MNKRNNNNNNNNNNNREAIFQNSFLNVSSLKLILFTFTKKKNSSEFLVKQQKVKSNEQRPKSNEQREESNEQRETSEKFHLYTPIVIHVYIHI